MEKKDIPLPDIPVTEKRNGIHLFNDQIRPALQMFLVVAVRLPIDRMEIPDPDYPVPVPRLLFGCVRKSAHEKNDFVSIANESLCQLSIDHLRPAGVRVLDILPGHPQYLHAFIFVKIRQHSNTKGRQTAPLTLFYPFSE